MDDLARSWEDVFGEGGAGAGPMIMAAHAPSAAEAPVHARWADLKDAEDDENAARNCTVWCEHVHFPAEAHVFSPPRADKHIEQEAEQEATEDIWVDEALDSADVITRGARKEISDKERIRRSWTRSRSRRRPRSCSAPRG